MVGGRSTAFVRSFILCSKGDLRTGIQWSLSGLGVILPAGRATKCGNPKSRNLDSNLDRIFPYKKNPQNTLIWNPYCEQPFCLEIAGLGNGQVGTPPVLVHAGLHRQDTSSVESYPKNPHHITLLQYTPRETILIRKAPISCLLEKAASRLSKGCPSLQTPVEDVQLAVQVRRQEVVFQCLNARSKQQTSCANYHDN